MTAPTAMPTHSDDGHGQSSPPRLEPDEALFVDFDGTLADLALRPEQVVVPEYLPVLLEAVRRYLGGAVAVLTGRQLADVDALLAPATFIGAGVHGAEVRLDPCDVPHVLDVPELAPLIATLRKHFVDDRRVLVEDKHAGVSLHFRMAPERGGECIEVMQRLARAAGMEVVIGNMVAEARPRGASKGKALALLAATPPFAGRLPVFVGDDSSDEDGFRAAETLGGFGIKVGNGASGARFRLATVKTVYDWLRGSVGGTE